jgi:hypothetical protein
MDAKTETVAPPPMGHNQPPLPKLIAEQEGDFAQVVTEYLSDEFKDSLALTTTLLDEARALPEQIDSDETKGKYTSLIKRIRDHAKALTAFHEKEKMAYYRGGQAVDQTFFGPIDKLARRVKTNKPGAADILNARLTDYDNRILAEKQAELNRIAAAAEREAEIARKKEAEELAAAEARRQEAERARAPAKIEEKTAAAEAQEVKASAASAHADVAAGAAQTAHIDTLAKPADLMRQRGSDGTLSTMTTEPYALVEDRTKLDFVTLGPYFSLDAIEKAVRGWAKNNGYTVQMAGASIGKKPKSVVR